MISNNIAVYCQQAGSSSNIIDSINSIGVNPLIATCLQAARSRWFYLQ